MYGGGGGSRTSWRGGAVLPSRASARSHTRARRSPTGTSNPAPVSPVSTASASPSDFCISAAASASPISGTIVSR